MQRLPHPTTYLQINILGEAVDLQWLPQRLLDDCLGRCVVDEQEIQLRSDLRALQCLDTLIHEIMHYISHRCDIKLSEHQVQILGMAWAQIFQANPELVGFIAERCEEEDERRIRKIRHTTAAQ